MTRDEGAIRVEEPFIPWIFPYQASLDSRLVFLVTSRVHCAVLDKDARKKIRVYAYRPVHFGKITVCRLKMAAAMKKGAKRSGDLEIFERESRRRERQVWWSRNSTFSVSLYIIFILENPRHLSKYQGCWRSSVSSVYFLKGRKTRLEGRRKRKSGKGELSRTVLTSCIPDTLSLNCCRTRFPSLIGKIKKIVSYREMLLRRKERQIEDFMQNPFSWKRRYERWSSLSTGRTGETRPLADNTGLCRLHDPRGER